MGEKHDPVFLPSLLDPHSISSAPKGGDTRGLELGPLWGHVGSCCSISPAPPPLGVFQTQLQSGQVESWGL